MPAALVGEAARRAIMLIHEPPASVLQKLLSVVDRYDSCKEENPFPWELPVWISYGDKVRSFPSRKEYSDGLFS